MKNFDSFLKDREEVQIAGEIYEIRPQHELTTRSWIGFQRLQKKLKRREEEFNAARTNEEEERLAKLAEEAEIDVISFLFVNPPSPEIVAGLTAAQKNWLFDSFSRPAPDEPGNKRAD